MRYKFRHRITFIVFRKGFEWYAKWKYRFTFERFKLDNGPYLILGNHTQALDAVYVALTFNKPIYFVASNMIYNLKWISKLVDYLTAPIPIHKFRSDLKSTRAILKTLKEGQSVVIYPEGNSTFHGSQMPIDKAIAKLVKVAKVPVLFHRTEGGYLSHPRWAEFARKGFMHGAVRSQLSREDIEGMDLDTVYAHIKKEVTTRDFELFETTQFIGKNKAEHIEVAYVTCPHCHAVNCIHSQGDNVVCDRCNFHVTVNDYGRFIPQFTGRYFQTTKEWYADQLTVFKSLVESKKDSEVLFTDANETLYTIPDMQPKEKMGVVTLSLSKDTVSLHGTDIKLLFDPREVDAAVQHKIGLILYHQPTQITYYLLSHSKRSALKYVLMIEAIKKEKRDV